MTKWATSADLMFCACLFWVVGHLHFGNIQCPKHNQWSMRIKYRKIQNVRPYTAFTGSWTDKIISIWSDERLIDELKIQKTHFLSIRTILLDLVYSCRCASNNFMCFLIIWWMGENTFWAAGIFLLQYQVSIRTNKQQGWMLGPYWARYIHTH